MAFLSSYSALFTAGLLEQCDRAPALANAGPRRHADSRRSSLPTTSSSSSKGSGSNRSTRHTSHLRSFLSLDISESIRTRDSTFSMPDTRPELPAVDSSRLSTSFIHSPTHSRSTSLRSSSSRALPELKPAPITPPPPSPGAAIFHHLPEPSPLPPSPRSARPASKPASLSLPSPKGSFDSLWSAPEFSPSSPFEFETSPTYSIFFPLTATSNKSFSLNPIPIKGKSKHSDKYDSQLIADEEDYDTDEKIGATQLHSTLSFRSSSTKTPMTRSSTVTSSYRRTKRADALERLQGRHFKSFMGLDDDEVEAGPAVDVSEPRPAHQSSQKRRRRKTTAPMSRSSATPGNSPTSTTYPLTLPPFNLEDLTLNLTEFEGWLDFRDDEVIAAIAS